MTQPKTILASYVGVLVYSSFVFLGAGRLHYGPGLLYTALALVGTTLNHLLTPAASDLATRRARDTAAGEDWDKRLLAWLALANVAMFVLAGMDSGRFHWTAPASSAVHLTGAVLMLAGQLLFALARRENAFFSSTVRIQAEHGHRVCDTGPYRYVRHPGYLGLIVGVAAFPLVMGAATAAIPAVIGIALLVVRTRCEDRFLQCELAGYRAYSARTRFRLLPWVY